MKIITFSSFICLLTLDLYKMQFQVIYFTFICYRLLCQKQNICFDLMFLSKINQVILVAILLFLDLRSVLQMIFFCDILLSLIPFWSDYLNSRWMLFSDKQNYNKVYWNYKAKRRCQCNIFWIFGEIFTFSFFICLKISVFCYCLQVTI